MGAKRESERPNSEQPSSMSLSRGENRHCAVLLRPERLRGGLLQVEGTSCSMLTPSPFRSRRPPAVPGMRLGPTPASVMVERNFWSAADAGNQ
jgi:hypothetical protein